MTDKSISRTRRLVLGLGRMFKPAGESSAPGSGTRSLAVSPDARFVAGGSFRGWVYL